MAPARLEAGARETACAGSVPKRQLEPWERTMKVVELGNTGQKVSQLSLGCMQMGTLTGEEESRQMLDRYVEQGGNFLDTANCYGWFLRQGSHGGESEAVLGRWLAQGGRRGRVFLATKGAAMVRSPDAHWRAEGEVDWTSARRDFEGAGRETLERALEASLRRLQTDHVDLYYVHVDDRVTPLDETLEALARLVKAGKARFIGYSNVRTWRLERIRQRCAAEGWPAPVALQQQHTYLRRRQGLEHVSIVDDEQLDYLREHPDLTLVAYSPILKGLYDATAEKRRGHWAMQPYLGSDSDARLAAVAEIARRLDVLPHQLVLAWMLHQRSPRVVPLVGPRTREQLEQNLRAVSLELPPELCAELDRVSG
ncbi:aldo/keto reductase [Sorangium sp. So ce1078]|uniref:aldo/keto reductase n=1 Tax=Sorangium sp. So ce1078 TaxID=3133329 RepID=UPI003F627160